MRPTNVADGEHAPERGRHRAPALGDDPEGQLRQAAAADDRLYQAVQPEGCAGAGERAPPSPNPQAATRTRSRLSEGGALEQALKGG
eukprot:3490900-Prymnesium_polylepis.1